VTDTPLTIAIVGAGLGGLPAEERVRATSFGPLNEAALNPAA
jgi:hypothetical protein